MTAFAHFAQETGGHIAKDNISDNPLALEEWQQALVHVREMGWSEGQEGYTTGCGQNDWQNKKWPCATGKVTLAVEQNSFLTTLTTALSPRLCLMVMQQYC